MNSICNNTYFEDSMVGCFGSEEVSTDMPFGNGSLDFDGFDPFTRCLTEDGWYDHFTNETICEDPMYYSHTYRVIGTFFQGIIFLVGVFGNLMVVVVVARTQSMHSPTNCYLVSLAIADSVVLITSIPQELVSYYVVGNHWIWGDAGCWIHVFLTNLGINASSLSLAAFTVERYIAICKPFLAQTVCTVSRAKKIIGSVWVFATIYCFPWLFLSATFPLFYKGFGNILTCQHKISRDEYLGYYFTDLVLFYLIPLIMSVVLYGLIARILYRSHSSKASNGISGPLSADSSKTNAARVQVVKMLVMIVVIFAILWLPYRGLLVYNSFAKERYMDLWYLMFAKTCVFINSAINPILYNAMSRKFRTAFGRVLACGKNQGDFYGRWPNGRTHTTMATPSTALPSTTTLACRGPSGSNGRKGLSTTPSFKHTNSCGTCTDYPTYRTPTTMTYFEVVVDTNAADTSCSPSARTRPATDAVTQV